MKCEMVTVMFIKFRENMGKIFFAKVKIVPLRDLNILQKQSMYSFSPDYKHMNDI